MITGSVLNQPDLLQKYTIGERNFKDILLFPNNEFLECGIMYFSLRLWLSEHGKSQEGTDFVQFSSASKPETGG